MADRLLFSKTGRAKYISHLDLMRTFQRAFLRAELPVRPTEGFNPHAFVSIPLPLSVGYSSSCEVLEVYVPAKCSGNTVFTATAFSLGSFVKTSCL